jgi:uncharacterized membrane protein YeiH
MRMKTNASRLLLIVDLAGTFLFGMEGTMTAIRNDLDFFGVLVLAFTTALVGGVIRDLLIGAVPPASLRDSRYAATAFAAGATVFVFHHFVVKIPSPVIVGLDAAGLGLFAVAGTEKALEFGIQPFIAMLLGTITGVGGGTVRDMFLAQVPSILRSDIYATAALTGAIVLVLARKVGTSPTVAAFLGGMVCFVLRVVALWRHWNLPKVGDVDSQHLSGGRSCWYGFALAARVSHAAGISKVRADDSPGSERPLLSNQMARMEELHRQSILTAVSY